MKCPFLSETRVKYCEKTSHRKLLRQDGVAERDVCSTWAYVGCSVYQQPPVTAPGPPRCPHFHQSLVQYCAAAATTKFIPFSESLLSRCGNGAFRYCEVYSEFAGAGDAGAAAPAPNTVRSTEPPAENWVDDIRLPNWLAYARNHMWLEQEENGNCHVGIDGLLAKALGAVDEVTFLTPAGLERPSVVLRVGDAQLQLVFPHPLLVTGANVYLRSKPARLTEQPYSAGWLFEGAMQGEAAGLVPGSQAPVWMRTEVDGLSRALHERVTGGVSDGGAFSRGFLRELGRDQALGIFNEFFSPFRDGKA